jgi:hypothetical protein
MRCEGFQKIMKVIKGLAAGALYYIIITAVAVGLILAYCSLQIHLFGKGNYLLFESDGTTILPIMCIILIAILFCLKTIKRFENGRAQEPEISDGTVLVNTETSGRLNKLVLKLLNRSVGHYDAIAKLFKIGYITILIISLYCSMTSYTILYEDSVVWGTPLSPRGTIYSYRDIVSVNVGIRRENINLYSPYYEIVLFDGKSANLMGVMVDEGEIRSEYVLADLDRKLKMQGITKNVSNARFAKFAKGMDKKYVMEIEKLFER